MNRTIPKTKAIIYIGIATLTFLSSNLSTYKSLSDITPLSGILLGLGTIIVALNTLRAFLDVDHATPKKDQTIENTSEISENPVK